MSSRADAVQRVIQAYLDLPDTPEEASHRDFKIVSQLIDSGIEIDHILHAIKLGFVRRWARDHSLGHLEAIHSFAYFRTVLNGLTKADFDALYVSYVAYKYSRIHPDPVAWHKAQLKKFAGPSPDATENLAK